MLCEVAWAIAAHRNMYLSSWYWKMKQRKGSKKAIIALAHKLLVIIYTMLKTNSTFSEQCFEIRKAKSENKRVSIMIHELVQLGFEVKNIQN